MIPSDLKVALRSLLRNRFHFSLNLLGLTLSLTAVLFIVLYLYRELTFDNFHADADRIYRVVEQQSSPSGGDQRIAQVSFNASTGAREEIAGVDNAVKILQLGRFLLTNERNQNSSYEEYIAAEQAFFDVLTFPLERGDPHTALMEPKSIVLSQDLAQRLFGDADPIGKVLRTDRDQSLTVTGVFESIPENSHLYFPALVSHSTFKSAPWYDRLAATDWRSNNWLTYLKLEEGANPELAEEDLNELILARSTEDEKEAYSYFELQSLRDIHFFSQGIQSDYNRGKSGITYVYLFGAVGLFILFIACINYINLMTARSSRYGKEVGVRKVVGATRRQLIGRFLSESFVVSSLALLGSLVITALLLPRFNSFMGATYSLDLLGKDLPVLFFLVGILVTISFLSGLYPALYLSRFNPVRVLRSKLPAQSGNFNLRRALVVFQFVLATVLITGTLVAFSQMQYIQGKNLGFDKDQLVVVDINSGKVRDGFATIKEGYEQLASVEQVSVSSRVPGEWKVMPEVAVEQPNRPQTEPVTAYFIGADEDFLSTFNIELLRGRNFRGDPQQDSTTVLLNEAAAQGLGIKEPTGQEIVMPRMFFGGDGGEVQNPLHARVIGIVRNFHYQSLYEPLRPLVIGYRNNPLHSIDYFTARVPANNTEATIARMEEVLHQVDPNHIFEYHFLDEQLQLFYEADERRGQLFTVATSFAIFIACLGLFGLAAFMAEQRTKEIGIRKILGASVTQITTLLSKDFLMLVGLAVLIGLPIAWWAVQRWLENFAFNIGVQWWMFALPVVIALLIALLTVSFHAVKAGLRNPVEALRYE